MDSWRCSYIWIIKKLNIKGKIIYNIIYIRFDIRLNENVFKSKLLVVSVFKG